MRGANAHPVSTSPSDHGRDARVPLPAHPVHGSRPGGSRTGCPTSSSSVSGRVPRSSPASVPVLPEAGRSGSTVRWSTPGSAEARLALLPAPRLARLAFLAGVTLLSTTIAQGLARHGTEAGSRPESATRATSSRCGAAGSCCSRRASRRPLRESGWRTSVWWTRSAGGSASGVWPLPFRMPLRPGSVARSSSCRDPSPSGTGKRSFHGRTSSCGCSRCLNRQIPAP